MARTWILPAGAGVLSALLFLSAGVGSFGAMILSNLAALPLFAMGLGSGLISNLAAGTSATLLIGAVGVNAGLSRGDPLEDSLIPRLIPAIAFAVLIAAPTMVLVRQALLSRIDAKGRLEWYPPGRLVMWLVGIGMATFLIAIFFISGGRSVEERLNRVLSAGLSAYMGPAAAAQLQSIIDWLAALPTLIGLFWLLLLALNGILAQGLLAGFRHNIRPSPAIGSITLPRSAGIATAVIGGLAILAGGWLEFVARNLLVLLTVAFFFAGLGVVHGLLRQSANRLPALIGFYALVVLFFYPVMALVALIGFIDHWAHFRQRFGGPTPGSV